MPDIRADGVAVYVYRRTPGVIEFLQIRRSSSTGEYQQSWQTVYGGIHRDASGKYIETAVQAALRELQEETALVPISLWQVEYLESFYFKPHDYVLIMPVFAAQVDAAAPITLNEEHDDFRWIPEPLLEESFMWRTQREALQILLQILHNPGLAQKFLDVDLPRL